MVLVRIGESLREVGRSLETDYVCVSASVYVQHASAFNCRGFPQQLTAAGFIFPRQLTTERHFRLLHVFLSQTKCVNKKFPKFYYKLKVTFNFVAIDIESFSHTHLMFDSLMLMAISRDFFFYFF